MYYMYGFCYKECAVAITLYIKVFIYSVETQIRDSINTLLYRQEAATECNICILVAASFCFKFSLYDMSKRVI